MRARDFPIKTISKLMLPIAGVGAGVLALAACGSSGANATTHS